MYGSVSHHSPETALPGSLPVSRLGEQLAFLTADGWQLTGITDALRILAADRSRRVIALTFDGGLLDFLNAFDELRKFDARATLFVPTGTVGLRVSRWDRGRSRLGWDDLREVTEAGIEIGSQSVSCRALDVLGDAALQCEVLGSKHLLEDRLGVGVGAFCHPYGLSSARVRHSIAEAGYSNACSIAARVADPRDDVFDLPRLRVRSGVTGEKIGLLLHKPARSTQGSIARAAAPARLMTRRTAVYASRIARRRA